MIGTVFVRVHASLFAELADARTVNPGYSDISLKRNSSGTNMTMQTDLILDNVVRESSVSSKWYCDTSQEPTSKAISLCLSYASANNLNYMTNSARWASWNSLPNKMCAYNAMANFNTTQYSCNVNDFPSAASYCASVSNNYKYYGPSYWDVGTLEGNMCVDNGAVGIFDTAVCDNVFSRSNYAANFCKASSRLGCNCDMHGYVPVFTYSEGSGDCTSGMEWTCNRTDFFVNGIAPANPPNPAAFEPLGCNAVMNFPAEVINGPTQPNISCGSTTDHATESTTFAPELHQYRNVNFGAITLKGGATAQLTIKADAAPGVASYRSKLDINNAGVEAGTVLAASSIDSDGFYKIIDGQICSANDLGKIAQEPPLDNNDNQVILQSQLQCVYNPTFCVSSSYCYLPAKTTSTTYLFNSLLSTFTCPGGTELDASSDISQWITTIDCVTKPQITQTGGRTATGFMLYTTVTGTCINNQQITIPILKQAVCVNAENDFVVSNYQQ